MHVIIDNNFRVYIPKDKMDHHLLFYQLLKIMMVMLLVDG